MSYQKEIHFSPLNKNNNLSFNEHNVNYLDDEDNKSGSDIEMQTNTYPLKITLVGNSSVGKTSVVGGVLKVNLQTMQKLQSMQCIIIKNKS